MTNHFHPRTPLTAEELRYYDAELLRALEAEQWVAEAGDEHLIIARSPRADPTWTWWGQVVAALPYGAAALAVGSAIGALAHVLLP